MHPEIENVSYAQSVGREISAVQNAALVDGALVLVELCIVKLDDTPP